MATLVLAAAGAAVGSAVGGSVLGLSAAVLGRAAGATLGQMIDQRLMGGGSEVLETGRVDRFRLTGASEGTPVPQVYGRIRIPGQVIWASRFTEKRSTSSSRGGKGSPSGPDVRSYRYTVSLALALCEGEIAHVGRVWADGREVARDTLNLRIYPGSESQMPDPKIAAVEGAENAPAYRGTAYVVLEDLELAPFGNRVPQFSFEVVRTDTTHAVQDVASLASGVEAVALIPGTGEYSLATTPVHYVHGAGKKRTANQHAGYESTDFEASVAALEAELPNCKTVSMVVSWFGDDLRCGECSIRPMVEHKDAEGAPMPWRVAGQDRLSAPRVPLQDDRPVYGGTPTDASVSEAITELRARGREVIFYPFILMTQLSGNARRDPWTGADEQPRLPWRGRITASVAPGEAGTPDGTAAVDDQVERFFGTARASDFAIEDGKVRYTGPNDWGMNRFILHYAALCVAAGGVDAFCIGSEMRGLTQLRGANGFPAVDAFKKLAKEVRSLVGRDTKVGYAADWSEYFGYVPKNAPNDRYFHLDPLWADPEIDFVGIDNYMPLSDWRNGPEHADSEWGSIYNLDYLKSNIAGGEGYDWFYADEQAAEAQLRTPITDGAHNEPWVYRYKDLLNWWRNPHHERINGLRQSQPTDWAPRSKPFWFTEYGCAAVDKASNQPNKFLDPKSSESLLPRGSDGSRDDLIQMQYLRAMIDYWGDPDHNPSSPVYNGPMVDMSKACVWSWDARPYPAFPGLPDVWSDGDNYIRGHWLNGRTGSQPLDLVIKDICARSGLFDVDTSRVSGLVRGYSIPQPGEARRALEPLLLAYGVDAHERDGTLVFRSRDASLPVLLPAAALARHPEREADCSHARAADGETAGRVRLTCLGADGVFSAQAYEAVIPGEEDAPVATTELNLVMTAAESLQTAERWLSEARIARDTVEFALPPSALHLGPGDVISLPDVAGAPRFRIDRSEDNGAHLIEATRVEAAVYDPGPAIEESVRLDLPKRPMPASVTFLDLPLMTGDEVPHAPHIAVSARPWLGEAAVYASRAGEDYRFNTLVSSPAVTGVTRSDLAAAPSGILDRGPGLRVELADGALASVTREALLNGANAMAIGDGVGGQWEIFQFERAELVGADEYELSLRLRGQLGTDAIMPEVWPAGSVIVLLDDALEQIDLPSGTRSLERSYRVGPADLPVTSKAYVTQQASFAGVGLRPLSPVHLTREPGASGDIFRWIRRSRIDADAWDLDDIPLGEDRERYRIRIKSDGVVRRQVEVSSPKWTYTPQMRADDGVTGGYAIEVEQLSERFGPGPYNRKVFQ